MRLCEALIVSSLVGVLCPAASAAQEATGADAANASAPRPETPSAPPPSGHARYLDARLGFGWLWDRFIDTPRNGPAVPLALSVGVALTPRLVLFGEFSNVHMFSPNQAQENLDYADLFGFGPGLKYYVTPSRVFVAGSVSLSWFDHHGDGYSSERLTYLGVAGRVAMGKEWWWSPSWGLGVAGELLVGRMRPEQSESYTTAAGSLRVSLSYNLDPTKTPFPALASSEPADAGFHRHRLYLDARVGVGGLWVHRGDYLIRGTSIPFALSGGLALSRNLVLLGELYDARVSDPRASYWYVSDLELYGVGPGVKYYLTPKGFFVSGAVLVSRLRYEGSEYGEPTTRDSHTSQWGGTARFSAGQEWPISRRWSLGLAGELLLGRMGRGGDPFVADAGDTYVPKGLSMFAIASFHDSDDVEPPPSPLPPGYRTHDGVYINVSLGVGWLRTQSHADLGRDLVASGRGRPFALSFGYVFAKNLVLAWDFCKLYVSKPSVSDEQDGVIATLEWDGTGPGARYYLPLDIFVGGSLLLSQVRLHSSNAFDTRYGIRWDSGYGITGRFSLGKEFWISDNWGLGFGGELLLGRLPGSDGWGPFTTRALSLLASASFN